MRNLTEAKKTQQALDLARRTSLPVPEVRELDVEDLMPSERTAMGAFLRAWATTEWLETQTGDL